METSAKRLNEKSIKAYLTAFAFAFLAGLLVYILSGEMVLFISTFLPVGLASGIALEQRLNKEGSGLPASGSKGLKWLLALGILFFIVFFILVITL